ncbi:MAG: pentapeptide repeat-containing protein, partial [Myxococcota bacterium]|nr:pentapeptide repeat-containing protein [Myxococcota bacterium]
MKNLLHRLLILCPLLILSACDEAPSEGGGSTPAEVPACRLNSDCPVGQRCEAEACVPESRPDAEAACEGDCPCQSNGDCAAGEGCDVETGECFALECLKDGDCALGEVCVGSRCVTDLEADRDRDSIADNVDNCPNVENPEQEDLDGDELGDACDEDDDGDGVLDASDNCALVSNPVQGDADQDRIGNRCDEDMAGTSVIGQISAEGVQLGLLADTLVFLEGRGAQVSVDESGFFRFEQVLQANPVFRLRVERPGYDPLQIERIADLSRVDYDCGTLSLSPKRAPISGRIELEGRGAVGGVQLNFTGEGEQTFTEEGGRFSAETVTWPQTIGAVFEGYQSARWPLAWDEESARFFVTLEGGTQAPLSGEEATTLTLNRWRDSVLSGTLSSPIEAYDWSTVEISLSELGGPEEVQIPLSLATQNFSENEIARGDYELRINAPGHIPVTRFVGLRGAGDNSGLLGEIVLTRQQEGDAAVSLAGHVELEGLGRQAGVLIQASIADQLQAEARSGEAGAFRLEVGALDYDLRFSKEGYAPVELQIRWDEAQARFEVNEGDEGDEVNRWAPFEPRLVRLERDRRASISGSFRLSESISDYDWDRVRVTLFEEREVGEPQVYSFTLDSGTEHFAEQELAVGNYQLVVRAPGHRREPESVVLGPGERSLGMLTLEPVRHEIEGRVHLAGRDDHAGIEVIAGIGRDRLASTQTDGTGRFSLPRRGLDHQLSLNMSGFAGEQITHIWEEDEEEEEETGRFLGQPARAELGELSFGPSAPAAPQLALQPLTGDLQLSLSFRPLWLPQDQGLSRVRLSNELVSFIEEGEGSAFRFNNIPAGRYLLSVNRRGFQPVQQLVELVAGNLSQEIDIPLEIESLGESELDLRGMTVTDMQLRGLPSLRRASLSGVTIIAEADRDLGPDDEPTGPNLCGLDLREANLSGAQLLRADLSGADLTGATLNGVNLREATLRSVNLSDATLFNGDFFQADFRNGGDCDEVALEGRTLLVNADFSASNLSEVVFTDAAPIGEGVELYPAIEANCEAEVAAGSPNFDFAHWDQSDLSGAVMVGAQLRRADFNVVDLQGADLRGACLEESIWTRSDLRGAYLSGADLSRSDLLDSLLIEVQANEVDLSGVEVAGSNLSGGIFRSLEAPGVSFSGTIFDRSSFDGSNLRGSSWVGALLDGVSLSSVDLSGSRMSSVELIDVVVNGANFEGADLRNAQLSRIDFSQNVILSESLLGGANMSFSNLEGADLSNSELLGTNFLLARYSDATRWREGFAYETIQALGPETELAGFNFPNDFNAEGVQLRGANLANARMERVNFAGGDLSGADLQGVEASGANLSGADLSQLWAPEARLINANLENSRLFEANLPRALLAGANFTGSDLSYAYLFGVSAPGSQLNEIVFEEVSDPAETVLTLTDADLTESELRGTDFLNTSM